MHTTLASDADILLKIEEFCERENLKPSTFGRLVIGDPSLIANLRAGRSLTLKSAGRILDFMVNYQRPDQPTQAAA